MVPVIWWSLPLPPDFLSLICRYSGRGLFLDPPECFISNEIWSLSLPDCLWTNHLKPEDTSKSIMLHLVLLFDFYLYHIIIIYILQDLARVLNCFVRAGTLQLLLKIMLIIYQSNYLILLHLAAPYRLEH